jgi:hypothetical protein
MDVLSSPSNTRSSELAGLTCTSAIFCMAVGGYRTPSVELPLAQVWNGSGWSVLTPPYPSGTGGLSAVSCISSVSCIAVGTYWGGGFAENWNGTTWTLHSTATPVGALARSTNLEGVSCASTVSCTAVGSYQTSANSQILLVENFNGTDWSIESAPAPDGSLTSNLHGVSCSGGTHCTAVGSYQTSASSQILLVENYDGTIWSIESAPAPKAMASSNLSGVSCTTSCLGVGSYTYLWGQLTLVAQGVA